MLHPFIVTFIGFQILIWAFFQVSLGDWQTALFLYLSFIPARFDPYASQAFIDYVGGDAAKIWSFITYSFVHINFEHLFFNSIWLLITGNVVLWRMGVKSFLWLYAFGSIGGALMHFVFMAEDPTPMIGASASISALTAVVIRFMFQPGGPFSPYRARGIAKFRVPALPLKDLIKEPKPLIMLGLWFGSQLLIGIPDLLSSSVHQATNVAWQAHIGGFLVGLFMFYLFDPIKQTNSNNNFDNKF